MSVVELLIGDALVIVFILEYENLTPGANSTKCYNVDLIVIPVAPSR